MLESPKSIWFCKKPSPDKTSNIANQLFISPILAQVLLNRGLEDINSITKFLKPDTKDLSSPFNFIDMHKVVNRILEARDKKQTVLIHGDYDVDGITSTTILYLLFKQMDINVDVYLPDRFKDGYGLNINTLKSLNINKYNLIITADCGITAHEQAQWINEQGVELIIIDHHKLDETMPKSAAIIHPDITKEKNFNQLCAASLALKVVLALTEIDNHAKFKANKIMPDLIMLATFGIICDVMPLIEENRIIVNTGLKIINGITKPGLSEIIKIVTNHSSLTAGKIGFQIGPRINAGGRMAKTRLAFDLFTTDNPVMATKILQELETQNNARQAIEKEITKLALEQSEQIIQNKDAYSIVAYGDDWHEGVIGIVASRLIDAHYLPSIVIAFNNGMGKGSCRSIDGCDIHKALSKCSQFLETFGGHSAAAGLSIKRENINVFIKQFNLECQKQLSKRPQPKQVIDIACLPELIDENLMHNLKKLEPFGYKNPKPTFGLKNIVVAGIPKIIGKDDKHLMFFIKGNGRSFKAIGWNMAQYMPLVSSNKNFSIIFTPILNSFNGQTSIEFEIKDIRLEN